MSIATEITRLQNLKADLRTKLVSMLGLSSTATLEACVTAVKGIAENGAVTGSISTKEGQYAVPKGYHNGGGKVSIAATEQAKIIAGNIKAGVTILGVAGSCSPASDVAIQEAKSVTPTKSTQSITPDEGYVALAGVNVAAIPDAYQDVSNVDAAAANVLSGKKFVTADGKLTTGTMANNGAVAATINGTTVTRYVIPAGYHSGTGTVTLDNTIETALAAI